MNRCMIEFLAVIGSEAVIQSRHHHAMPYQCSVADKDTALVLKLATRVDKDVLPYMDILSEVGIKRWEQTERIVYLAVGIVLNPYYILFAWLV